MKYTYNKLVRDKIPENINSMEGRKATWRIMSDEEYIKNYLNSKGAIEHSKHVEFLSLKIYNELKKIFPHKKILQFENAQKLISYSALLHDIGTFLEYKTLKAHNKAGCKLVLENKIDGLSENETKTVALCIRYHRGSKPKEHKHKLFQELEQKDKNKVRVISAILRIADALDSNHMQNVENILLTYDFTCSALILDPCINIMFNKGVYEVFNKKKTLFEDVFEFKICLQNE